jgi:hypothetical protein
MSLPIYPLSLSLFFSLLFCTCVMGATTWNQHNGGWDFTDSATVFPFFFSDKRGIKNTHIATWTDGWMASWTYQYQHRRRRRPPKRITHI